MYKSITVWQGEPEWDIKVTVDGFTSISSAANFGSEVLTLKHKHNTDYLTLSDRAGKQHQIEQYQVTVLRIKQSSERKLVVSGDDYQEVDIQIRKFSSTDGLNSGFGSLAYGVEDSCGQKVPLALLTD